MAYTTETELLPGRGVEWFAGQIPSPVRRLRFLQEYAPRPVAGRFRIWRAGLLTTVPVSLLLITAPPQAHISVTPPSAGVAAPVKPAAVYVAPASEIWIVEKTDAGETYSNGLRVDNRFAVATHPRSWLAFPLDRRERAERHTDPAGIVFHTTESMQAPFEAGENARLQRIGQSLLEYVKEKRSYNFVIDRFGRVYRVVREEDAANHAGHSVWSDSSYVYLNLNDSFLAVAFETETQPGQDEATISPAQVQSAAMLIDMLRGRYKIAAANCVTHGQVSVNASNLQIGYHLDWASSFPFAQIGLPDNYAVPLPAVAVFGFGYDQGFARRAGDRMFQEAEMGDRLMRESAAAAHVETTVYRRELQQRYWNELAALGDTGAANSSAVRYNRER